MASQSQQQTTAVAAPPMVFSDMGSPEECASDLITIQEQQNLQKPRTSLLGKEFKALVHHSGYYLAGMVGSMAIGLLSFPIFTRVLSTAEYGVMDLGQRILLLLTILSKVGLQNAALRFYDGQLFATDHAAAKKYYSTMYFGVLATSFGVVSVALLIVWAAPGLITGTYVSRLMYLVTALVVIRTLGAILWAFLRIEERSKLFNAASVSVKAISVGAICVLFPFVGTTAQTTFLGTALVELGLIGFITVWLLRRDLLHLSSFDRTLFRTSVAFGSPLVVYEFAFILLGTSDRFLVRYFLGADALGFYSVASGLARNANDLLLTPLGLALVPIYMRLWNTEGPEKTSAFLNSALDGFVLASLGMLAAVAASGRDIVLLLASAKYDGAERIVPVLLGGLIVYAMHMFVGAGLLLHKRTLRMAGLLVVSVVVNVALNVALVPRIGLLGGALATLLSYSLCIAMLCRAAKKLLPVRLNPTALMKYSTIALFAWLLASRVNIASPVLGLVVKTTIAFGVYGCLMYCIDQRVRGGATWAVARVREVIS